MKNLKGLITTLAIALTTSVSAQAIELVQVENLNNNGLEVSVNTELAQSLKSINTLTLNVEKSAQDILVIQTEKQFDSIELDSTFVAIAE